MTDINYGMARRAQALEKALTLPLPDAVYEIVRYNDWAGPFGYTIELSELQAKGSDVELQEWKKKSHRLRADAYAVGDAGLRSDDGYAAARARFEATNPGFNEASYESAISHGFQQAR
ncbi:hypothetical protein SKP52_18100 [Sphingopyxis fribergensis]|uniref:Uncharacterized protein n=1 Tax=Sphingopyxis fribergensis TaxID=1515612 RepID=A0A0A7PKF6_9SPHN|nr:hypothetical protein [Sphingopyxis fribergensis]AJA10490.1 hypothetical protein SKP52_18100 [Sphingopyxis fribergensis]